MLAVKVAWVRHDAVVPIRVDVHVVSTIIGVGSLTFASPGKRSRREIYHSGSPR